MQLTSSDFSAGGAIPVRFTCEGDNVSPEFSWKEAPGETKSFALIVHVPDAPRAGGFTHWVLYNIPAEKGGLDPNVPKRGQVPGTGTQGRSDSGEIGYMGPCLPSGTHRYYVRLFALDTELKLIPGATHDELTQAMEGTFSREQNLWGLTGRRRNKPPRAACHVVRRQISGWP